MIPINPPRHFLQVLVVVLLFISAVVVMAQSRSLFSDVGPEAIKGDTRATAALERIKKRKTVADVRVVRVNSGLLTDTKEPLTLNVFTGKEFPVVLDRIERRADKGHTWIGRVTGKIPGRVTFVVRAGNVTGMIRPGNEIYSLEPLGEGLHALIRVDPSKFPPDHPPSFDKKDSADARAEQMAKKLVKLSAGPWWWRKRWCVMYPDSRACRIDVVVAFTPNARAQVTDIEGLIQLAVDETNQSYVNSGVRFRLGLPCTYETTGYTESGSFDTDLERFRTPGDGHMDEIHAIRDQCRADVAVLIINNSAYCGLAWTILAGDADEAFAVVHYDCATGYYSFAHEIGHLQGARHNCEIDANTVPTSYGHGYRYALGGWRTIMAYNDATCQNGNCTRLQYWSNPNVSNNGVAMGSTCPTANSCCADNTRTLNETRWGIVDFR